MSEDILIPKVLVLNKIDTGTVNNAQNGTIGMSGANLVFWNGSAWKTVTSD